MVRESYRPHVVITCQSGPRMDRKVTHEAHRNTDSRDNREGRARMGSVRGRSATAEVHRGGHRAIREVHRHRPATVSEALAGLNRDGGRGARPRAAHQVEPGAGRPEDVLRRAWSGRSAPGAAPAEAHEDAPDRA